MSDAENELARQRQRTAERVRAWRARNGGREATAARSRARREAQERLIEMHRCENDVFVSRHLSVGTERQKARGRAFSDLAKRYPEQWTDLREMTR